MKWLLKLLLLCGLVFVGWVIYLDMKVVDKFTGKKWSVPAKVYARPLEVFVGGDLSPRVLVASLVRLGYRSEYMAREAGSFFEIPGKIIVYTRGFLFGDGEEPSHRLVFHFQNNRVLAIENAKTGKGLDT